MAESAVKSKEVLHAARRVEDQLERTAKRLKKMPLQVVKGQALRAEEGDRRLLGTVDEELKKLKDLSGAMTRSLNEVEVALLQLRHSKQVKGQARRHMTLADKRKEKASARAEKDAKKAAAKARKAEEKKARRAAREARKLRKAEKKAAEKAQKQAARQAKKDARKRARKAGKDAVAARATEPATSGPGAGLLVSGQSEN